MKRIYLIIIALLFCCAAFAQQPEQQGVQVPEGYVLVDSLIYVPTAGVDSTLAGRDIFELIEPSVQQPDAVRRGFTKHLQANRDKVIHGYRVRIFFDNKQDARSASEQAVNYFRQAYPGVTVYRSYTAPFFKVTVGDCRTRSEAMQLLQRVRGDYPSAFVIKETIAYPPVDKEHSYIVDTVQVLRPVKTAL
jgi:hypothetical protein